MAEINRIFKVNGKPFFPIGTETVYAGYALKPEEHENVFRGLKAIHGNSMAIPVHWDAIEPKEGKFDFSSVDLLIADARKYGLKLVLLWFGTWKNGSSHYIPPWMKNQPDKYPRIIGKTGRRVDSPSPHAPATLAADIHAFSALMRHLKAKDTRHTVIMVQVEN